MHATSCRNNCLSFKMLCQAKILATYCHQQGAIGMQIEWLHTEKRKRKGDDTCDRTKGRRQTTGFMDFYPVTNVKSSIQQCIEHFGLGWSRDLQLHTARPAGLCGALLSSTWSNFIEPPESIIVILGCIFQCWSRVSATKHNIKSSNLIHAFS